MQQPKRGVALVHGTTLMGWALLCLTLAASACNSARRLEFGGLATADRLELNLSANSFGTAAKLITVTDRSQIDDAAAFFNRYHDGWVNVWSGGAAPLFLRFYKGGEDLATFGVGERFLSVGTWARYLPEAEIATLARRLGLPWPPH